MTEPHSAVWLDGDAEAGIALLAALVAALRADNLVVALPVVSKSYAMLVKLIFNAQWITSGS